MVPITYRVKHKHLTQKMHNFMITITGQAVKYRRVRLMTSAAQNMLSGSLTRRRKIINSWRSDHINNEVQLLFLISTDTHMHTFITSDKHLILLNNEIQYTPCPTESTPRNTVQQSSYIETECN